jgi:Tol biopolymer transport system component
LPPTPTPNPALANFSFCNQTAGDAAGGRFSAQITGITTTVEPAFERITIGLNVPGESAPPHAIARCLSEADDIELTNEARVPGQGYVLHLELGAWLHDNLFRASPLTGTTTLSGTTAVKSVTYRYDEDEAVGATLIMPLEQPFPFRVTLEENPTRIVLEVAKTSPINQSSDTLRVAQRGNAQPDAPLFFLRDGDVWKFEGGNATNLTNSPEAELALAVDSDAGLIAFCRAAPGVAASDTLATSTLWLMNLDGGDQDEIAPDIRTCAEPVFSPNGNSIALSVDETGASPQRFSIYTVSIDGGDTERVTSPDDEWSRFGPQWLDDNRLIYAASAEDGRSTLFIASPDGAEEDVGAALVLGDRYRALGRPLVAPDGATVAIEGLRASNTGADLILLDANGAEQDTISDNYWVRPVAWGSDGTLYYLTSACESDVVQNYTLHARAGDGNDRVLTTGLTTGGYGHFVAVQNGLAYVALNRALPGPRGPLAVEPNAASALWFWSPTGNVRTQLVESNNAIAL